jgi:pimeloyl-ACP methyl ester carboxylesterase
MQFELNSDYKTNLRMYAVFQEYFRTHQPPAVVIWGKHDAFFEVAEAFCYQRDLHNTPVHILDGGHMALETNFNEVTDIIQNFMNDIKTASM